VYVFLKKLTYTLAGFEPGSSDYEAGCDDLWTIKIMFWTMYVEMHMHGVMHTWADPLYFKAILLQISQGILKQSLKFETHCIDR
jgi:hypothetical protein